MITRKYKILSTLFLLSFSIFLFSCSNSIPFQSSRIVPAAEAEVKVDKEKNNNYEIEIEIENLAKPGALSPPRNTYVAWYQTPNGTNKLGQIKVRNNLKASLETVIPVKPNRVFITAENDPEVGFPSRPIVLETDNI